MPLAPPLVMWEWPSQLSMLYKLSMQFTQLYMQHTRSHCKNAILEICATKDINILRKMIIPQEDNIAVSMYLTFHMCCIHTVCSICLQPTAAIMLTAPIQLYARTPI